MKTRLIPLLLTLVLAPLHALGGGAWLDSAEEARRRAAETGADLLILYRGDEFDDKDRSPAALLHSPHFTDAAAKDYVLLEQAAPATPDNDGLDERRSALIFADASGRPYYHSRPNWGWGMDWMHEELAIAAERRAVLAPIWKEMEERPADQAEWQYARRLFAELALHTECYYEPYRALLAEATAHGDNSQEERRARRRQWKHLSNSIILSMIEHGLGPEFMEHIKAHEQQIWQQPSLVQSIRFSLATPRLVAPMGGKAAAELFSPEEERRVTGLCWQCVAEEPRTRTARYLLTQVIHSTHCIALASILPPNFNEDLQGALEGLDAWAGADASFKYRQAHALMRGIVLAEMGRWDEALESLDLAATLDPLSPNAKDATQIQESIRRHRARLEELLPLYHQGDAVVAREWNSLLEYHFKLGLDAELSSDPELFYMPPGYQDRPRPQAGVRPIIGQELLPQQRGVEYRFHDYVGIVAAESPEDAQRMAYEGHAAAQKYMARVAADSGDHPAAIGWLTRAAGQGDAQALAVLGDYYMEGLSVPKDEARALDCFRQAAEKGYAYAQMQMAQRYLLGVGVERDEAAAVDLFRKAGEQGGTPAIAQLGACYMNGIGVAQDVERGLKLIRSAAEAGDKHAQHNLGLAYLQGEGVEQDTMQARYWLEKAAGQGLEDARYWLRRIERDKDPWAQEEAEPLTLKLDGGEIVLKQKDMQEVEAAAAQGDMYAQLYLASQHRAGSAQRIELLRQYGEAGNSLALCALGRAYVDGEGVEKDMAQAARCFARAAELGDARAEYSLGYLIMWGLGVPKDEAKAVECFRRAAEKGDAEGQCALGLLYMEGKGLPRDLEQARHWLEKADAQGNDAALDALFRLRMEEARKK